MIIPSIDMLNNQVVRLYQGNYDLVKYYDYQIYDLVKKYYDFGINTIHIVDLDAANNPHKQRNEIFYQIIQSFKNCIQIAGGIRSERDVDYFLSNGAKRVVIGLAIFEKINEIKKWIKQYGNDHIVAALDIHIDVNNVKTVYIQGWKKNTNISLEEMVLNLSDLNIKYILCTDISKDGTLLGPNFKLYEELIQKFPGICFQSSGGVQELNDIVKLKKIGVDGIIIGKSLLEKRFNILEAIQCWQNESFLV